MIRKCFVAPWFGPLPDWFDQYTRNFKERLSPHGYDLLMFSDLDEFKARVHDRLGVECPVVPGEGKVHDYRCTFGVLFQEELEGYDFWGHTDFDIVYGRVQEWVTDEFLEGLDIHSNHDVYMSGPWSLYRNTPTVNALFTEVWHWDVILEEPETTGWVETSFTAAVDAAHAAERLRRRYTMWQTRNLNRFDTLHFEGDRLMEGDSEVMMAHFRRTKVYPELCVR